MTNVEYMLTAVVVLLAVTVCASVFLAHREIRRHNEYLKEIK